MCSLIVCSISLYCYVRIKRVYYYIIIIHVEQGNTTLNRRYVPYVPMTLCPHDPMSLCPHVPMSPCPYVLMSPCFHYLIITLFSGHNSSKQK